MFGKDSTYCELGTGKFFTFEFDCEYNHSLFNRLGRVTGLKEARVTNVCLGKAHALALTENGEVFSFGMNNKGQCGRDGVPMKRTSNASFRDAGAEGNDIDGGAFGSKFCAPTHHRWIIDQCMICVQCNQCTVTPAHHSYR